MTLDSSHSKKLSQLKTGKIRSALLLKKKKSKEGSEKKGGELFLIKPPVTMSQGRKVESTESRLIKAASRLKPIKAAPLHSFSLVSAGQEDIEVGTPLLRCVWERDLPNIKK